MSNNRQKFCLPSPHPKELRDRARSLYESGAGYQEINEATGLPCSTIRNWRKRDSWCRANSHPDFELVIADDVPAEAEEIPSELWDQQNFYQEKMSDSACRLAAYVATLKGEQIAAKATNLLKADAVSRKALKLETERPFQIIQIGVLAQSPAKQDQRRRALPSLVRPQESTVEQLD